jgi:hypothetical protein
MPCAGELSSPSSSGGLLGDIASRHAPRQGRRDRIVCCVLVPPQPCAGEAETLRAAGELAELVPLNSSDLDATAGCPAESFGWRARKCSSRAKIGSRLGKLPGVQDPRGPSSRLTTTDDATDLHQRGLIVFRMCRPDASPDSSLSSLDAATLAAELVRDQLALQLVEQLLLAF